MNGLETRMLAAAENQTRHLRNISENLERLVDLLEKRFEEDPVMAREEQFEKNLSAATGGYKPQSDKNWKVPPNVDWGLNKE